MITDYMTAEDIYHHIVADHDLALNLVFGRMRNKILKSKRKGEPFLYFRWRSYKTRQQYIVCVCHVGGTSALIRLVAEVQHRAGNTYYTTHTLGHLSHIDAYTSHYVSRFIERTGMTPNRDRAIATITSGSPIRMKLYANEDSGEIVYMCQPGIDLCTSHERIITHRTFVSSTMLRGSQIDAYNRMRGEYEAALAAISQTAVHGRNGCIVMLLDGYVAHRAQAIYSQYFNNLINQQQ